MADQAPEQDIEPDTTLSESETPKPDPRSVDARLITLDARIQMLLDSVSEIQGINSNLQMQVAAANSKTNTWPESEEAEALPDGSNRYEVLAWTRTVAEDATDAPYHWMPDWVRFHG
jgi:hypothetical protein